MLHGIIKQSTAVTLNVGPFVDDTDFKTVETGLTIANTDVKLSKNGSAGVNKSSGGGTHRNNGMYALTFDSTDTNTVGELSGSILVAGALVVVFKLRVLEEAIYDALWAASADGFDANGRVDVGAWLGTAVTTSSTTSKPEVDTYSVSDDQTAANNLELDYDGTGLNKSNSTIGTCTTNTDMRGTDSALLAASAPTNFGDLAITVTTGKVTVGTNDDKAGYSISGTITTLDALDVDIDREHDNVVNAVESLRDHHTGRGNVFYWAPINGNDGNDGLTKATAKATFANIQTNLVEAWNNDVVYIIPDEAAAQTIITEKIDISKEYTFVRGTGRAIKFKPTTTGAATVICSVEGVEFKGAIVETHTTGNANAIEVTGDFVQVHNFWVDQSRGHGVLLQGASNCVIHNFTIQDAGSAASDDGININGTSLTTNRNVIYNGAVQDCNGDGIHITGSNATENFIFADGFGMIISGNAGWGVLENNSADKNVVLGPAFSLNNNTSGAISLSGAQSFQQNTEQYAKHSIATETRLAELDPGNLPSDIDSLITAIITNAAGVDIAADIIAIKADTASILVDTSTTLQAELDAIQAAVITNAAGVDIAADIIALKAETATILVDTNEIQGKLPSGNFFDFSSDTVDVGKINGSAPAAVNLALSANTMLAGTVDSATFTPTTIAFEADDITEATADHFNGRIVIWTSGALIRQATDISDYVLANSKGKFTVTAMTEAPADNDTFIVV